MVDIVGNLITELLQKEALPLTFAVTVITASALFDFTQIIVESQVDIVIYSITPMHDQHTIVRFSDVIHYIDFDPAIERSRNVTPIPFQELLLLGSFIRRNGGG